MGVVGAVVGAVAGIAGSAMQARAANKQAKAQQKAVGVQKESLELQKQQQQLATRRSRRRAIREAQIARAQAVSAGANYGGLFGSSLAGGLSSLGSQVGAELGFSTQMSGLSRDINAAEQKSLDYQSKAMGYAAEASMWGGISSLGFGLFQQAGGFGAFRGMGRAVNSAPTTLGMTPRSAAPAAVLPPRAGFRPVVRPTTSYFPQPFTGPR